MSLETPVETVLRKRFSRIQIVESLSNEHEEHLVLRQRHLLDALDFLQKDPDTHLNLLVDISAVHHHESAKGLYANPPQTPFFEVFYVLRSTRLKYRLRISVFVSEEEPLMPTVTATFPNANWLEREMWDLFGIFIEGHPDMRRLLLPKDFTGHPLRKDYEESFQS